MQTEANTAQPTTPLHQYSTAQTVPVQTIQAVPAHTPYPAKAAATNTSAVANKAMSAGIFGMIVVSTGTLGANLNHVGAGNMSMGQAVGDSLAKGAVGGVAAASATAASESLTDGGAAGLAVTLAAATGVSYLINKVLL